MSGGVQTASIAVYTILEREDGKVAFVMRSNKSWMNHRYSLLAGRAELNEEILTAAIREAKEEGGVSINPKNMQHVLTMHRNEKDQSELWIDVFFKASKWEGDAHNAEPDEHSSLDWLDSTNLPENVIPMQAAAIKSINSNKSYLGYGWL